MPEKHRRSIRLKGYDYRRAGAYFVTIVTQDRRRLFGEIICGEMRLSSAGAITLQVWNGLPDHYPGVELDEFIVMPNHVHAIIVLNEPVGAGLKLAPTPLSEIVRALKTFSARKINELHNTRGTPLWQRNYYEHIIRSENELERIRLYIKNNPAQWELDHECSGGNISDLGDGQG